MTSVLAAEEQQDIFILPNATFFVELIIFLVILWIFAKFIVPPLSKAMREREEMNRKQVEDRDNALRKLEEAQQRYDTALAEARAEGTAIRDEARADAQQIRDDMRAQTDREVEQIYARGEEQLAARRAETVRALRGEVGGLSTQLAEKVLGSGAQPRQDTVDRFLGELDQREQST